MKVEESKTDEESKQADSSSSLVNKIQGTFMIDTSDPKGKPITEDSYEVIGMSDNEDNL